MGADMTAAVTIEHGQVAVFVAVDHFSAECAGIHAALRVVRATRRWSWCANAARHRPVLTRLRDYRALPWTGEWRGLQVAVSSAGVKAGDNPVAALLRHAEGRAPRALDLAWTRAVDRTLRRAGRADLAKTFAANLRRLDALHDVPDLAASGLLPPRF